MKNLSEDIYVFNWKTTKAFKNKLHLTLLHKHHLLGGRKQIESVDGDNYEVIMAKKHTTWFDNETGKEIEEHTTYALDPAMTAQMPLKVDLNKCMKEVDNKNVFYRVLEDAYTPMKITPKQLMSFKELIDTPKFGSTNEDDKILFRIIAVTSFTHRIFIGIATNSHFGKDSYVTTLNDLTDEMPFAEMGSTAAMLRDLNPSGCLWFNETNSLTSEMIRVCENLIMKAAAGQTTFKNEKKGSAAHNTKDVYDIENESIGFLYNTLDQYPDKSVFFDNLWKNKTGVQDRILRIKLSGKITERFSNNFDVDKTLIETEQLFKNYMRSLHYYRTNKFKDLKPFVEPLMKEDIKLTHRQLDSFEAICQNINKYCETQEEYTTRVLTLLNRIKDYQVMLNEDNGRVIVINDKVKELKDYEEIDFGSD